MPLFENRNIKHPTLLYSLFFPLMVYALLTSTQAAEITLTAPSGFCKASAKAQKEKSFWQRGLSTITSAFSWHHKSLGKFEECQKPSPDKTTAATHNKKITFSVFYNISGLTGSPEGLKGLSKKDYFLDYKIKSMRASLDHAIATRSRYTDKRYVTFPPQFMGFDNSSVYLMSSHKVTQGKTAALQLQYCALSPFKAKIIHFCWAATAKDFSHIQSAMTYAKLKEINHLLENYVQQFFKKNGT